jgi:hypothetical protein
MHYLISDFWYEQSKTCGELVPAGPLCSSVDVCVCEVGGGGGAGAAATTAAGAVLMDRTLPQICRKCVNPETRWYQLPI